MQYEHRKKILVTGPQAGGTTLAVQLLHKSGLDCGFPDEYFSQAQMKEKGKGLEYLTDRGMRRELRRHRHQKNVDISPRVVKKPFKPKYEKDDAGEIVEPLNILIDAQTIFDYSDYLGWEVDHVLVTTRVWKDWLEAAHRHDVTHKGGLTRKFTEERDAQRWYSYGFLKTLQECHDRGISHSVLLFPKFARDFDYCWANMSNVPNLNKTTFERVWHSVVDEKRIHVG